MATAQILLAVKAPGDVPRETFQSAVEAAVRSVGGATSAWTYDATPVLLERDTDSAFVQTVKGGPWAGLSWTSGTALPAGQSSAVISAYRQNVVGLPAGGGATLAETVGTALRAFGEVRSGVRTIRNTISWDRGVPAAIPIAGSGSGSAQGVAAAAGIFGLLTLAAIYGTRR
jgi:hypothetical protein